MSSNHAVVIGGSMTGMLTARVLADHFARVTVIERDRFPEGAEVRSGVPQARHIHLLLSRGFEIMDALFPDFDDDLEAAGAPKIHWCLDAVSSTSGGWLPRFNSGIITRVSSRALLDWTILNRLKQNPRIAFLEERQVTGLLAAQDNSRVLGIRMKQRGSEGEETLSADLVVDASGRDSHAPEWLHSLGYEAPPETHVNSFLGYSTRWYERPDDPSIDWRMLIIGAKPPQIPRGGGILEVEGGRWAVTVAGASKDYPPTDEDGFLEFARSLMSPVIYEAIKNAKPISGIYGYRRTSNRLRHYEKLSRLPGGFVVLGDAACAFNPVYGQGMTVGAMGAVALGDCLHENNDLMLLPKRFQKRLADAASDAWVMATGEDLRYPTTEGDKPSLLARLTQKYMNQVLRMMPSDADLTLAFIEVMNLRQRPASLFHPKIVWKVVRGSRDKDAGKQLQRLADLQPVESASI